MTDLRQHLDQARTLAHEGRYWAAIDTLEEARLRISRASADPWSPPEALADVLLEEMKLWCRVRWLADTDLPEAGERAMAVEQAMRGLLESANPLTNRERASAWQTCGRCCFNYGRFHEAADCYGRAFDHLAAEHGSDDPRLVEPMLFRAESLRRCDILDQAHEIGLAAYERLRQLDEAEPWYLALSAGHVGQVLLDLARFDDAKRFLEEAAAAARGRFPGYCEEVEHHLAECNRALASLAKAGSRQERDDDA